MSVIIVLYVRNRECFCRVTRLHCHSFFISAHNLTDLIKYTKHPYVLFHFKFESQRIYIDNTEQVCFQHCLTRSILQIIESENNTKIENF